MSLEFKGKFSYPKPYNKDYCKNYFQQMEASGQFKAGLVCDKQFYKDDSNYPGKAGSKNHPKVQKRLPMSPQFP